MAKPDLRERVLRESHKILRKKGVSAISMREVARNLGVSHGAPYRHFPSKDHILAELAIRAFRNFRDALLRNIPDSASPEALESRFTLMGRNYIAFAMANPDDYAFMFSRDIPDGRGFEAVDAESQASFALLTELISSMMEAGVIASGNVLAVSMFAFASLHGMVSLMQSGVAEHLVRDPENMRCMIEYSDRALLNALKSGLKQV